MNSNELILKNRNELTEQQLKFVTVHENIMNAGVIIMEEHLKKKKFKLLLNFGKKKYWPSLKRN